MFHFRESKRPIDELPPVPVVEIDCKTGRIAETRQNHLSAKLLDNYFESFAKNFGKVPPDAVELTGLELNECTKQFEHNLCCIRPAPGVFHSRKFEYFIASQ